MQITKKDNTMILCAALVKISMSRVFPFLLFHRQNQKKRDSTWQPRELSVGRERYALSSLPELITKPQPLLRQRNQCDDMEGFWCTPWAFSLSFDSEPVFWLLRQNKNTAPAAELQTQLQTSDIQINPSIHTCSGESTCHFADKL